jgi:hypothetical protein
VKAPVAVDQQAMDSLVALTPEQAAGKTAVILQLEQRNKNGGAK